MVAIWFVIGGALLVYIVKYLISGDGKYHLP